MDENYNNSSNSSTKDSSTIFYDLVPIDNVDLGIYGNALNYVFDNDKIRNIAISGPFGSGKSSLIETFKNSNKGKNIRFLNISLANFNEAVHKEGSGNIVNIEGDQSNQKKINTEYSLEGKIINQLIHQIDPQNIPQSQFKRKNQINKLTIVFNAILFVVFIFAIFTLIYYEKWLKIISSSTVLSNLIMLQIDPAFISILLSTIIPIYFIYKISITQKNSNIIKKLILQGNEIELFTEITDSQFDKHLSEILYLISNCKADAIIFDDIDRYENIKIFQKLRDINILANINNRIRFFYLIKDDMFNSKERTKFFDFIIPVIPVISSSNSYDILWKYFNKIGILELFDDMFLQKVSLYIDDIRILKNIYNEYVIYNKKINNKNLNNDKFLAIIVYKNIFPEDFNKLQFNSGYIYNIINNKDFLINKVESIIRNNIKIVRKEINNTYGSEQAKKMEILDQLENRLSNLYSKKLYEILNFNEIDKNYFINFNEETLRNTTKGLEYIDKIVKHQYFRLLKLFILEGYIDETYSYYISLFYTSSFKINDKNFLLSIYDNKPLKYDFELFNPKRIIKLLNDYNFKEMSILNFSLIQYLILNNQLYENKFIYFLNFIIESRLIDFINQFYNFNKDEIINEEFIVNVLKIDPKFYSIICSSKHIILDRNLHKITIYCLYNFKNEYFKKINYDGELTKYIHESKNFLNINNPRIEDLILGIKSLDIKFDLIDYLPFDSNILYKIYEESLYVLNFENIKFLIKAFYSVSNINDIKSKSFSIIKSKTSPLYNYIKSNMEVYFNIVLENCDNKITDNEESIIELLNDKSLSLENKITYISYNKSKIRKLESITNKDLYKHLINNLSVEYKEDNIIFYYNQINKLDSELISFIESGNVMLDFNAFVNQNDIKIFIDIINSNELNIDFYSIILKSLSNLYRLVDSSNIIHNLDNNKIKLLIDLKIINMNKDYLSFMRLYYNELLYYFIENNIDDYIEIMEDPSFIILDEIVIIINSQIHIAKKHKLLELINAPISIINNNFEPSIISKILIDNFNKHDFPQLLTNFYDISPRSIKKIIENFANDRIDEIIENSYILNNDLFDVLINSTINFEQKKYIFLNHIEKLDYPSVIKYLKKLNMSDFINLLDNESSNIGRIHNTEYNKQLLQKFNNKFWVGKFRESSNKNIFIVYKVKNQKHYYA